MEQNLGHHRVRRRGKSVAQRAKGFNMKICLYKYWDEEFTSTNGIIRSEG